MPACSLENRGHRSGCQKKTRILNLQSMRYRHLVLCTASGPKYPVEHENYANGGDRQGSLVLRVGARLLGPLGPPPKR